MNVRAMWIPKSEKGREVARFLREEGTGLQYKHVLGHYVGNLDCELGMNQLAQIAYILDPEGAYYAQEAALKRAQDILDNPYALMLSAAEAEVAARRVRLGWMVGAA